MIARDVQPEIMDQPGLDPALHRQALRALARINAWSGTARVLWPAIRRLAEFRPCRVLDVASGGGDVACRLALWARLCGLPVEVEGCDVSPTAVSAATEQARHWGLPNVRFVVRDVLEDGVPGGFDVVTCTLFLHHLSQEQAQQLLRRAKQSARYLVLVDDLRRTRIGYTLAVVAGRLLTRSPVVCVDGPLSVKAAFTLAELFELARSAGMTDFTVHRHWPQRMLLTCRTGSAADGEAVVHEW